MLDLSRNKITHIEKGAFRNMDNLTELYLHWLQMTQRTTFKGLFKDHLNLQTLAISGSFTTKHPFLIPIDPASFGHLKELKFLELEDSTLTFFDDK